MLSFKFDNLDSTSFNLKVKQSNHISIPARRLEMISIPGRTGDLILDDQSRENLTINLVCALDVRKTKNFKQTCENIQNWLQGSANYKDLQFSDGYKFKAVCINQIDISKVLANYGEVSMVFSAFKQEESNEII